MSIETISYLWTFYILLVSILGSIALAYTFWLVVRVLKKYLNSKK